MFRLCAWSIHFWRRDAASTNHCESTSKAVEYSALMSCGTRSIGCSEPLQSLRSMIITSSHRPRRLRSRTRPPLITLNSPDRLDLTDRLPNDGSIDASTPTMLEMVAVGAMATQLE